MREIGGYIEFERFFGSIYHEDALRLNCGRACLAYLIAARGINRILLPEFLCDSVETLCRREGVTVRKYSVGMDFQPIWDFDVDENEYLCVVDYYGQLTQDSKALAFQMSSGRLIVDETQNYFARPLDGVDTFYTCRKYFGVPDGGLLYTDAPRIRGLKRSESRQRVDYLIGRLERSAGEFLTAASANNESFADEPVLEMSQFTENMLRGIDYRRVVKTRNDNFDHLESELGNDNQLELVRPEGPFAYPLLVDDGMHLKQALAADGIFIPTLWPNVAESHGDKLSGKLARDILPLPVDQRYGEAEMLVMVEALRKAGAVR